MSSRGGLLELISNNGKLDSMLTADTLLRERLARIYNEHSLDPIGDLINMIEEHNFDAVKEYCDNLDNHENLQSAQYDNYHPVYIACQEYEINILTYLLELNIFDDWQVNEMHKPLCDKFTALLEKDEEKKITDEVKQKQDIVLNMIKYYANTYTKRARSA